MERWWWKAQIDHYHEMQTTCEAHGDLQGAKIYRQAIESATAWLGKLDDMKQSNISPHSPDA